MLNVIRQIRSVSARLLAGRGHVPQPGSGERLAGAVTALAAVAALAVALAIPLAYMIAAYGHEAGAVELRAELYANAVVDAAGQSPPLWNALLGSAVTEAGGAEVTWSGAPNTDSARPERRRLFARDGRLVAETAADLALAWPILARRLPVVQNSNRLGEVEVARSIGPAVRMTAQIGAVSLGFGLLLLLALRVVPLRLMREALERASYLSMHDLLTGLPNRVLFNDRLELALAFARRDRSHIAVLCLDLDHFKEVNDTLGHAAGDALLREVSVRMRACLREGDVLARFGGDEFAIALPQIKWPDDAETVAQRLVRALERPFELQGHQARVGVSIGITLGREDADAGQLLKDADLALYQAKESGRGQWCFFAPEMNARLMERRALEADLRVAVETGDFAVHYQPQVSLETEEVIGAEALLRWNRPGHGPMAPDRFIWLAEEIGLIGPIGAWVLREACRTAKSWPEELKISVNVSPVQFRQKGFYEEVVAALEDSGLAPDRLELEITEGVLLHDTEETLALLSRLRAHGVRLAMDDFGTGYSSLSYLQKFRFDKVKIDRSFIARLTKDPNAAAIVRAVIELSRAMGVRTNAEGVEDHAQAEALCLEGCSEIQGYLYGRPMPAADFARRVGGGPATSQNPAAASAGSEGGPDVADYPDMILRSA